MQTKDENLQDYSPIPEIWNYAMVQQHFTPGFYINRYNNVVSSMASKPINIRWIITGSQLYGKIMYSIVLQTISFGY